jgi:hypothetical protein
MHCFMEDMCNFIIWGLVTLCVEAVPSIQRTALLPCSGGNAAGGECVLLYRSHMRVKTIPSSSHFLLSGRICIFLAIYL